MDVFDIQTLRNLNIRTVLSLESGWYHRLHRSAELWDDLECRTVLKVLNVPLSWWFPPTRPQLEACIDLIYSADKPLLIHCKAGVDRTGVVCAYYRRTCMYHDRDVVLADLFDSGFHWARYCWWLPAIYKVLD